MLRITVHLSKTDKSIETLIVETNVKLQNGTALKRSNVETKSQSCLCCCPTQTRETSRSNFRTIATFSSFTAKQQSMAASGISNQGVDLTHTDDEDEKKKPPTKRPKREAVVVQHPKKVYIVVHDKEPQDSGSDVYRAGFLPARQDTTIVSVHYSYEVHSRKIWPG
jgi:hypothetical protein